MCQLPYSQHETWYGCTCTDDKIAIDILMEVLVYLKCVVQHCIKALVQCSIKTVTELVVLSSFNQFTSGLQQFTNVVTHAYK